MNAEKISTQEWYDFIAPVAMFMPGVHAGEKEATRKLMDLLKLAEGDHVLDVGSGPGITAAEIAGRIGSRVTGIDISTLMVEKARERARKSGLEDRIQFQEGNVFSLDFKDDTFDAVIFESLLTILPGDPAEALAEIVRVLKPGGKIGCNEATVDPAFLPELLPLIEGHPAVQRAYTPDTLRLAFEAAGLEGIEITATTSSQAPSVGLGGAFQEIGCGGLISFFVRAYPKLVWKLISDPRIWEAQKIDQQITSLSKDYMGYALILGQKPSPIAGR